MKRLTIAINLVVISITITACGSRKLLGPTFTPTSTITLPPTSTPTLTPTSTTTPSSTFTLTPSPTPTPFGGGGQLIVQCYRGDSPDTSISGIYSYNISTQLTNLILDNYILAGTSTDGSKLLVSPMGKFHSLGELYLLNLDGSDPVLISKNFGVGGNAYWFSDSNIIVFRAKNGSLFQLYTRGQDGTMEQITKSTYGVGGFLPVMSNGGIYWIEDDDYRSYGWRWTNIEGTETKKFQNWIHLTISPNGEYIAYDYWYQPIPGRGLVTEFYISKTDGSNPIKLDISEIVKNPSKDSPPFIIGSLWFPDSQRILFTILLHNSVGDTQRYLILSTSGELLREINMVEYYIDNGSWSPDGRQYVFITGINIGDNYVTSLKVLDIETMQIQDIDLNISNDTPINSIFWLP
jgi:hypothetical protein